MFAGDYYILPVDTMNKSLQDIAPFGTYDLAEPVDYMDFDKLTASTTLLQERYPGSSMAVTFQHTLEASVSVFGEAGFALRGFGGCLRRGGIWYTRLR
jgi:hypothetical protein